MDISDTDKLQGNAGLEKTPEEVDNNKKATTNETQAQAAEEKLSSQEATPDSPEEAVAAVQETEADVPAVADATAAAAETEEINPEIKAEAETEVKAETKIKAKAKTKSKAREEAETEAETETKEEAETKAEIPTEDESQGQTAAEASPEHASIIDYSVIKNLIDQLRELIQTDSIDLKSKVENIKQSFYKQHKLDIEASRKAFIKAGGDPADFDLSEANAIEAEFKDLMNQWREKRIQWVADFEKQKKDNLLKKVQLIEVIKALTESPEDIRKKIPDFRKLQQEWKNTGPVPSEEVNELWKNYQFEVERFYDQIKINNEFRDYDFKKNLEIKTELCVIAEKLKEDSDVVKGFKRLQKLHEEWRETGPVAPEFREEIWQRFKD
ncbi:MAG: DUF349 domain-containing protein, partial [Bacteroidales bacterium]